MQLLIAALVNLLAVVNPSALVDTFVGTSGTQMGGPIDTFPGADVPFGMLQWSPDTPSGNAGGGYEYTDRQITGFSLTHLSGPGCSVFGDFGILPTTGDIPRDPSSASQAFSHSDEQSAPGWYGVSLGEPAIRAELTVTKRTGIGRFTFPATTQADLLFNASSNQAGVTTAHVGVDAPDEVSGSASSGFFCGMPDRYTVYFVARFDRPFRQHGSWQDGRGMWLTFDTTRSRTVTVKVALSFVSVAGAKANLAAENPGWDLIAVRDRATESWAEILRRIAISGGTREQQRTFYTAFYHTLLHPNVISDVDGRYAGFDGKVHRAKPGHDEYANYSDWDIYRTEAPLLGLIAPVETSDMMQSLVDAFDQEGWLPRWPVVNGPSSVMGGDSVVPVIAGAYAFGARDFDALGALRAMLKGATSTAPPPAQGWYYERWELHDDYLRSGYVVNKYTTSVAPMPNGASETLEYALDDFSIARLAFALHDERTYETFLQRSSNWASLFNVSTGWIAPRDDDGAFMQGPLTENGQTGFQEGNAAQYTWMVPQNLRGLVAAMGGPAAAVAKLDTFFSQLNAGPDKPYAWLGNEPSLGSPWVYLSAGEPWRAHEIVRAALTTLYRDAPDGLPGNDDLGTMSAWYVWCAMGIYPQNPAVRYFDIGTPLFSGVRLQAPGGPAIEIHAAPNAAEDLYLQSLRVDGRASDRSWVALPQHGRLRLDFRLAALPNKNWGAASSDAPPAYVSPRLNFPPSTAARFAADPALVTLGAGGSAALRFAVSNQNATSNANVTWHASLPDGLHLDPERGSLFVADGAAQSVTSNLTADASLRGGYYDVRIDATAPANQARLAHLDLHALVTRSGESPVLAYTVNRFGNAIVPVDLSTHATAPEIGVGEDPHDAVLAQNGSRLYVTNSGANSVSVIDTAQRRSIQSVKVGTTPMGIAITPDGRTVWVANSDDGTIQPIDTATLRPGAALRVGSHPRAIAVTSDGARLYVSNSWSNSVTPVDLRSNSAGDPIPVGLRPAGLAIAPDGKRLYVVDNASNDLSSIDLTGSGRNLAAVPVGVDARNVAIAPDGRIAYVTNHAESTITPVDLAANKALAPIVVGGAPIGVYFSRDGRSAWVTLGRDNACVVVDVASGRVSPEIPLGNGPYAIAGP